MVDEFQREKPDLVIYDTIAMWGYIAARTHNIPNICFVTTFVLDGLMSYIGFGTMARFMWSALPHLPKLMSWKSSMAREFGKDIAGGITEYADLNIVFTSQEFHPENGFIDDRFQFVGLSINPKTRPKSDFPFELLRDGKTVYISLGTINNLDTAFYQTTFAAFGDYPAQFILSVGKNTDISQLEDIPLNFIVRNTVPQLEVLQQVDVFITHGGMNSVHEGLYYGVPEIVVPQQFEQYTNGKRVVQVGAGLMLGGKNPYGNATVDELRQALDTILQNPAYQVQAQFYGQSLKNTGGYMTAVAAIENYVGVKQGSVAKN